MDTTNSEIKVHVVTRVSELLSLQDQYQELFEQSNHAHVNHTFAYLIANASLKRPHESWRCFIAFQNKKILGCLFGYQVARKKFGIPFHIFILGTEHISDPLLSPHMTHVTLTQLIKRLMQDRKNCPAFDFSRLTPPAHKILKENLSASKLNFASNWTSYGYTLDTSVSEKAFLNKVNSKSIQEINRKFRKLSSKYHVKLRLEPPRDSATNNKLFNAFLSMENSGWKGKAKTSIRLRPGHEAYYKKIIEVADEVNQVIWCELKADEIPIAMMLCFKTHNTLWIPKVAYDENYSRYGPGIMATHLMILRCLEDTSITKINCISATPWMKTWQPSREECQSILLFNNTSLARLLHAGFSLHKLAQKYLSRHPASKRPYI